VINAAGTATFFVEQGAEPLSVKISWVIIREDGNWKILNHHVSSKTPLMRSRGVRRRDDDSARFPRYSASVPLARR